MKMVTIICNIVLVGFTLLIRFTEGPAKEPIYIVFGLLLVIIPILNIIVISRNGRWLHHHLKEKASEEQRKIGDNSSINTKMKIIAIICNIVLLGFICYAIIDQYPHSKEAGVIEFTLLGLLTPILSVVAIAREGATGKIDTRAEK